MNHYLEVSSNAVNFLVQRYASYFLKRFTLIISPLQVKYILIGQFPILEENYKPFGCAAPEHACLWSFKIFAELFQQWH